MSRLNQKNCPVRPTPDSGPGLEAPVAGPLENRRSSGTAGVREAGGRSYPRVACAATDDAHTRRPPPPTTPLAVPVLGRLTLLAPKDPGNLAFSFISTDFPTRGLPTSLFDNCSVLCICVPLITLTTPEIFLPMMLRYFMGTPEVPATV